MAKNQTTTGNKHIDEWKKIFNDADKDKSGSLSKTELKSLLQSHGSHINDATFEKVFQFFDGPKGDSSISLQEFIHGLEEICKYRNAIKQVFDQFDADKSGHLDKAEVTKLLKQLDPKVTDAQISEIIKQADKSNDGKISFQEFVEAFT